MPNLLRVHPCLPNEILIDIFLRHNALPSRRNEPLPRRAYPCNGFNLMLVCRHWRALAISTPSLWQAAKVRGKVGWFNLVLERSKGLPLDVVIHRSASASNISKCTRNLSAHFRRVRSIHFPAMTVQVEMLNAIFRRPIPPLTDLDLLVKSGGPLNLSPDRLPALRSLRISSCAIPWNPTMLSRLRRLDLDECTCQGGAVTLDDLLDVLVSAVDLQDLRLRNFLSALRQPPESRTGSLMPILLPHLRKLEIYDLPHLVSRFLSFVRLEAHTDVLITGLILEAVPDTKDAFPSLLPHDRSGLPLLHMVTAGRIKNSHSSICCIEGQMEQQQDSRGSGPQITLSLDWRFCSEWRFAQKATSYLERTLREFAAVFAGAPLESLEIHGRYDHARHLDAWVRLYTTFPTIRHLELEGNRVPSAAVAAFGQAPYDDSGSGLDADADQVAETDSDDDGAEEGGAAFVLPNLRSLNLKSVDWCPGFTETLVTVIQRRATNGGLPKLERLELSWRNTSDEKGLRRTMKTYRSTLSSLVEEVEASFTARRLVQDDTSEDSDSNSTNSGTDTEDED